VFTPKKIYYFLIFVTLDGLILQVVLGYYDITIVATPFLSALPIFGALIFLCKMLSEKDAWRKEENSF
jgi:FtsH-binding integral membrane protein